jgi:hypothetical protein
MQDGVAVIQGTGGATVRFLFFPTDAGRLDRRLFGGGKGCSNAPDTTPLFQEVVKLRPIKGEDAREGGKTIYRMQRC